MKTALLLVALLTFSLELFAENNVTDANVSLSSNDVEIDDWDDDGEELDFEALKEAHAKNKEAHAKNKEAHQEKIKLGKILFANNRNKIIPSN